MDSSPDELYQNSEYVDEVIEEEFWYEEYNKISIRIPSNKLFVEEPFHIVFLLEDYPTAIPGRAAYVSEHNGRENLLILSDIVIEEEVDTPEDFMIELQEQLAMRGNELKPIINHEITHYFGIGGEGIRGDASEDQHANAPSEVAAYTSQLINVYENNVTEEQREKHAENFEEFYKYIRFEGMRSGVGNLFQYGTEETLEQVRNDLYNYWEQRISW